ncbi:MAG: class I SAM-dependent methyltransferase [Candidatus Hodarchaeales archaeon]|jgi:SAM-dependent methyltransferase
MIKDTLYTNFPQWYDYLYGQIDTQATSPSLEFIQWFLSYKNLEPSNLSHIILDMGSGTGRTLIPLTQQGYSIEGMEPFEGMIDIAHKKAKQVDTSITLTQGSYQSLSAREKYRLIFGLNGTMAYLLSSDEFILAFQNIYNALQPEGLFLVDLANFYGLIKNYKSPEPQEIEIEGKEALLVVSHEIDLDRTLWTHHSRIIFSPNEKDQEETVTLFEDIHELVMINLRELQFYAKSVGLKFIENFQCYEDRPDDKKSGSRLIAVFQKPK